MDIVCIRFKKKGESQYVVIGFLDSDIVKPGGEAVLVLLLLLYIFIIIYYYYDWRARILLRMCRLGNELQNYKRSSVNCVFIPRV